MAAVVLISGGLAAGKTSLAACLAARRDGVALTEDDAWVALTGGHGHRTPEQEAEVRRTVSAEATAFVAAGTEVVLELITYAPPPNTLTAYEESFAAHGIPTATIVLRADAAETLRRMVGRGRKHDLEAIARREREIDSQLRVLETVLEGRIVIETGGLTAAEVCEAAAIALGPG